MKVLIGIFIYRIVKGKLRGVIILYQARRHQGICKIRIKGEEDSAGRNRQIREEN